MHACMRACMYAYISHMYMCMHACMYVCMHASMHVCMYAFMYVGVSVCTPVCIYVYLHDPQERRSRVPQGCKCTPQAHISEGWAHKDLNLYLSRLLKISRAGAGSSGT